MKIRRADLPEANSQAIYQRMQTERQQEATEIRALGEQQARRIRAEADRDGDGHRRRGAAGSRNRPAATAKPSANRIFAEAFNADPEFFAFYRSMQAYEQGLGGTDTRWVISPDSEFFRYFNDSGRARRPRRRSAAQPPAPGDRRPRRPTPAPAEAAAAADGRRP